MESTPTSVHLTAEALAAGLDYIRRSPTDNGVLELIVRRPAVDQRDVLDTGELDPAVGLVGDNWSTRGSSSTPDGSANPDSQVTVMNFRCALLVAGCFDRVPLAGDQLFVDLDLSETRLPAGSRLAVGETVLEITAKPHRGCQKFAARYGVAALRFVNVGAGRELNLRGRNARVVVGGKIRQGDRVHRLPGCRPLEAIAVGWRR
ncbi:MAG: MOSC domain-containing protein [Mycobacteriales bacterium]